MININHAKGSFDYLSKIIKKHNNNKTQTLTVVYAGPTRNITIEESGISADKWQVSYSFEFYVR